MMQSKPTMNDCWRSESRISTAMDGGDSPACLQLGVSGLTTEAQRSWVTMSFDQGRGRVSHTEKALEEGEEGREPAMGENGIDTTRWRSGAVEVRRPVWHWDARDGGRALVGSVTNPTAKRQRQWPARNG